MEGTPVRVQLHSIAPPENFSLVPHLRIAGEYCPGSNQTAVTILKTRFF
jgi:hypothetical protein